VLLAGVLLESPVDRAWVRRVRSCVTATFTAPCTAMTPSVSAPRSVPVYVAPRIGRPCGFLPRLPSRLPPPSSVHHGVSLLRQVLLWLPLPFLRYLWHAFPATDTAVCFARRLGGRGSVCVLAAPQGRPLW